MKREPISAATVSSGLIAGTALALILVPVAFALSGDPQLKLLVQMEATAEPVAAGSAPRVARVAPLIEELSCFGCHNIERYQTAEKFSHEEHDRSGHCHVCHAFTGHAESVIRKEACVECH